MYICIQTLPGEFVSKKDKFYTFICRLSNINRFAGTRLLAPYTVAEHSFRVAILAMSIAEDYNNRNDNKISIESVLKKALLHDLEESLFSDIPSPYKKYIEAEVPYKKFAEKAIAKEILENHFNKDEIIDNWKNDKTGPCGEVIKIADMLELAVTASYELERGNTSLRDALADCKQWIENNEKILKKYPYALELMKSTGLIK